jgi:hypothetical protein
MRTVAEMFAEMKKIADEEKLPVQPGQGRTGWHPAGSVG